MITKADSKDKLLIKEIWDDVFSFDDGGYNNYYFDNVYDLGEHYTLKEADKLLAIASSYKSNYFLNNKMIAISMIVGVATKKEFRNRGYMSELLKTIIDILNHQELVTMIQAYDTNIYRRYGFEVVYYRKKYYFKKADIKIVETKGISEKIVLEDCLKAYALFMKHFNGFKVRSLNDFILLKKEVDALGKYMITVYEYEQIRGYFIFSIEDDCIKIDECIYLDIKTLLKIISYALKISDNVEIEVSKSENFEKIFGSIKSEISEYTMAKINDYDLYNKLYESDVDNVKDAFNLINKPLYMHEEI